MGGKWTNLLYFNLKLRRRGCLWLFRNIHETGSLSQVLCYSSKPTKMIAEQENDFRKDCEKRYSFIKLL